MANDLTSNITRKLMRVFLKHFESNRVVTKTVNTQLFQGRFTPASGSTIDIKRPHDYTSIETPGGDISADTKDDIVSGKATATVQNMITQATEWDVIEEALELDQLDQIIAPMARRSITTLETNLAIFMMKNSALVQGVPGTALTAWSDVAKAGALMQTIGVPRDMPWYYLMNPFSQVTLSDVQIQQSGNLASGLVQSAWQDAQISRNFGGMKALTADALASYTNPTIADRAGTLDSPPTPTYVSSKDSHQMTLVVSGFSAVTIVAGTVLEVPTRFLLNQSTRLPALDGSGANITWKGIVVADTVLSGTADSIVVSSPATFETLGSPTRNGAYNTVVAALTTSDVINIISGSAATEQPNLFYHPQAFSVATVRIPKLFSTDTEVQTKDGFSLRVSKYSDGDANRQKVRFDLLPAFAALNPWFAGHGWK